MAYFSLSSAQAIGHCSAPQAVADSRMLVVIDPSVSDYEQLAAGVLAAADVVVLDEGRDAIAQITQVLRTASGNSGKIRGLHLITHGTPGCLKFSQGELSLATLSHYAAEISQWAIDLAPAASLLLYGCHVAAGDAGEEFLETLYQLIKIPIAASTRKVGSALCGGSWQLSSLLGQPDRVLPFTPQALSTYRAAFAGTTVTGITPSANDVNALANSNVVITFDAAINPTTVGSSSIEVSGSLTGEISGTFTTTGSQVTFNPTSDFKPGEAISVVVTDAVQSVAAMPVNAYVGGFVAATEMGAANFALSDSPPSNNTDSSYDVSLADLDRDGDLDAFVANFGQASQVLKNDGSGEFSTFANPALTSANNSYDVGLADLDGDGDLDAFVANFSGQANEVLINDGSGLFSVAAAQPAGTGFSTSVSLGDLNGDGHVDAFVANFGNNQILLNDGNGAFTATAQTVGGGNSFGATLGDVNGDGHLDIFVANISTGNQVLLNDGTGVFSAVSVQPPGSGVYTDVSLGDLDSDGDLDAFVTENSGANQVLVNDGSGGFTLAASQPPSNGSSASINLADLDGDGDLDAFIATFSAAANQTLLNDGSGAFTAAPNQLPNDSETTFGADIGDLNGDGNLDIFAANRDLVNQIFFNTVPLNAAPSFLSDAVLASIDEGDSDPAGETVANLFLGQFQDPDDGASLSGVAIVSNGTNAATQGVWQYSLDATNWRVIAETVSDNAAVALNSNTFVRFLPNASYNGMPPSLLVRALDDTYGEGFSSGTADNSVDVSANGGGSAISASTHVIATTVNSTANLIYVNQSATGNNNGGSWGDAYTDLQSALAIASAGDEIWLAQGTYVPGLARADTFAITEEIALYGGFVGTEVSRSDRDFENNLTILSGEIGGAGNGDNSYHVVTGNSSVGAIIDGVIIQDGNTQGAAVNNDGGGIYNQQKLTLENVVVQNNQSADDGGGIRNDGELLIINSAIANNTAIGTSPTSGGGGLLNTVGATATVINTTFHNNQAPNGGAIRNDDALTLINATISGNTASESGGGLLNTTTNPSSPTAPAGSATILNSTITNNTAQNLSGSNVFGEGIANFGSVTATNTIIAGNNNNDDFRDVGFGSSTSNGNNLIGNGDTASGFVAGANNDLVGSAIAPIDPLLETLQNNGGFAQTHAPNGNSLAIDGGNNANVAIDTADLDDDGNITEAVPFDQRGAGFDRTLNGTVDIGAVESTVGPNTAPSLTGDSVLTPVDEDNFDPPSESISILFGAQLDDPDVGAALSGVAIVGNASGPEGNWEYSTDGVTWLAVGAVADGATALALSESTQLRFVPVADYSGVAPGLSVRALDDTYSGAFSSGASRVTVDTTVNGGRSAIAQATNVLNASVNPINDAPVLSVSGQALNAVDEDAPAPVGAVGTLVSELVDLASPTGGLDNVSDIDAGALTGIAITTAQTANGSWFYSLDNGASWLSLGAVDQSNARLLATDARVYFQPLADFNGSVANAISFRAWDQSAATNGDLVDTNTNGGTTAFSVAIESADIVVNPVNDAPTVALQNVPTAVPEDADTASRIKVADIVVSDIDAGVNDLSLAGADAGLFEIEGTELFLKAGVVLDYETQMQLDVVVAVDDSSLGTTPDNTTVIALPITDVNEAPSAIALQSPINTLAENTDTSNPLKLADIDITDDVLGTNDLLITGPDAGLFEVVGTELFLKAGTILDFEGQRQYDISIQVDDALVGSAPDATVNFSLEITDENESPTAVDLSNQTTDLDENTDTSSRVKVADITLTDDALGTNIASVAGADAASFEIAGNELFLKAGTALDFETKPQYDIVVQVDDAAVGAAPDVSAPFSLSLRDVNEAPSAIALKNTTPNLNENIDTSSAIKVADIEVSDDADTTNNVLSLAGVDAAFFEIVGSELRLKAGTSLDFETKAQYDVTLQVQDASVSGSSETTVDFTLSVDDVNDAPTGVTLQNALTSLAENADTTGRVKLADIAIADDALGTNTLTVTGEDAAVFEVVGAELFLKAGTTLDLENKAQYDVTVALDDTTLGTTPDATVDFSLSITDVNEAPTAVILQNSVTALAENTDTTARIKLADVSITDDAIGSNALSVTGPDATLFEVVNGELFLKAGTTLDSESQNQYDIVVQVDDLGVGTSPDATTSFRLEVTDVNEAPTAVTFMNEITTIDENSSTTNPIKVADINVEDDSIGVNSLSLTGADANADANNFEIVGTELFLKSGSVLDFESKSQYDIIVQVDDAGVGNTPDAQASFTLSVNDVNEAPNTLVLQNSVVSLDESADTRDRLKLADIAFLDDALGTNTLSLGGADSANFEIEGSGLFLKSGIALDFETKAQYDVTVSLDDAVVGTTPDETVAYSLLLTDANEAPTAVVLDNAVTTLSEGADTSRRIKLADISITDDALGNNTLRLTGLDANLFEVDNGELFLKAGSILDFETKAQYDVNVVVDDGAVGAAADAIAPFSLTITDENEAPSAITLTNITTNLDENSDTSSRLKLADIAITDDALGSNLLSLAGADAADFEIEGRELFLKAGTDLDFEAKAQYNVSVSVEDVDAAATSALETQFSLNLTDINEAPSAVTLQNVVTVLAENVDTSNQIKIADIAIADDALGNNNLTLVGADSNNFDIVDGALFLRAGTTLNRATKSQYDVTVQVDDASVGSVPDATMALSLEIAETNDAPTAIALQNVISTLAETVDTTNRIAIADITITDDPIGSNILSVTGPDADFFEIDAGQVFLKAGVSLDFEAKAVYDIDIAVDDPTVGNTPDVVTRLGLAISDENEAPSAIAFTNAVTTLSENEEITVPLKVADITITDDALGNNALSLTGVDAINFEIVDSALFLKAETPLDFENQNQYNVSVVVDDDTIGSTPDATTDFRLDLTDANEAPTGVTLSTAMETIAEDATTSSRTKLTDIVVVDDNLGNNYFTLSGSDASLFEVDGAALFLKAGVALDHEVDSQYDITVAVNDDSVGTSPDATVDFSLAVTDVDEAPVLLTNTLTIVKGEKVVLSRKNLLANDPDGEPNSEPDNGTAQLVYTISALNGGQFEQVSDGSIVTSFTQAQIDNGEIQFVHDDSDSAPSYAVSVNDGTLSTAPQTVTIGRFIRPGDGPMNIVPAAQTVDENKVLVFSVADDNQVAVENVGSNNDLAVTLSVDRGFLTLGELENLAFVTGDGKDDRTLEFIGAIANVNAALNGLILTPEPDYTGPINLQISSEEQGIVGEILADSDTVSIAVTPEQATSALTVDDNQLLTVVDGVSANQLQLSLETVNSEQVNEVVVVETDEQGRLNGLVPGESGYLETLVAQGRVVFSTLENGFDGLDLDRILAVSGNTRLQFAVIQGGSLDEVRQGQRHDIRLAMPTTSDSFGANGFALQTEQLGDRAVRLGFEIEGRQGFNDIVLNAFLTDAIAPTGSNLQDDSELIDLRGIVGPVAATFEVYREAEFDNVVGFFTVENAAGQVLDGQGNLLNVDDAGYVQAAMAQRIAVNLTSQNNQVSTYSVEIAGGQLLSSFIISDGSIEALLDGDTGNDPAVYFTHIGANSDRADHVRLLGDNTFGFEDTTGGGDQDFNDIVVKASFV